MPRTFLMLGAINAFLCVALGAFGAHGLKQKLSVDMLAVYQTGVQYHFYHALGLVAVGLVLLHFPKSRLVGVVGLVDAGRNHSVFRQSLCAESDGNAGAWCDNAIGRRSIPERMGDACLWSLVRKMSHAVLIMVIVVIPVSLHR